MSKLIKGLVFFAMLGVIMIGCGENRDVGVLQPSEQLSKEVLPPPEFKRPPTPSASLGAPEGGVFQSATLWLFITEAPGRGVAVRRITADWEETVVTWNNFGGAYAPELFGAVWTNLPTWYGADVSALVAGWQDGTYPDYGLLLEQVTGLYPRSAFDSREATNVPYLEICYTVNGGTVCEQIQSTGDAYIAAFIPDDNNGLSTQLFTGYHPGVCEVGYLSLLKFEGPDEQPPRAGIGDTVWFDTDGDGIQDGGEPGVPDVTVNLYDCTDAFVASLQTDADGYYLFGGLEPGSYYVEFILPAGNVFTSQDVGGDDNVDSDADPVTGKTVCTVLGDDEFDHSWDAGLVDEPDFGDCDGKVTQLTVRYDGAIVDAHIVVMQKKNIVAFDGIVQPGEQFTFNGQDRHGTLGPETYYYVNGVYNTNIHTSCSQPIGPGLVSGDFTVIEGYSRHGGLLPPL